MTVHELDERRPTNVERNSPNNQDHPNTFNIVTMKNPNVHRKQSIAAQSSTI
ncbi:unnamed protein product, partial [Rotaria sp. Silwood2]